MPDLIHGIICKYTLIDMTLVFDLLHYHTVLADPLDEPNSPA
jgi:hypothetical protein